MEKVPPKEVYVALLHEIAEKKGLKGDGVAVLEKIMHVESRFRVFSWNENSTAKGLFQCIDDTWDVYVKKHPKEITKEGRYDPIQQIKFAVYFTIDNERDLTSFLHRKPTHGEIYLAHFLGANGAISVLREAKERPNTPIKGFLPQKVLDSNSKVFFEMDGNKGLDFKEFTVGDLANWAAAKMGQKSNYYITNSEPHYKRKFGVPEPVGNMVMVAAIMAAVAAVAYIAKGAYNMVFGDDEEAKTPPPPPPRRHQPTRGRA